MKFLLLPMIFITLSAFGQMSYEPNDDYPYGQPNPKAPSQIKDFQEMIGTCKCDSQSRKPDGNWNEAIPMTWTWKYIMNGMAVQDETLKSDGNHSGSIRQFNTDSSKWYVHYYSSNKAFSKLSTWEGNKTENGHIVLYKDQPSPQGKPGFYRLTFSEISKNGYNWIGEWVDKSETTVYPTWKIKCKRKN